jgi:hypothetical protein
MALMHYRQKYLPLMVDKALPRVHPKGYWSKDIQSGKARKWLKYQALEVKQVV